MSAQIFPFIGSPLPGIVYLDTSFVREVYNPHADPIRQAKCIAFMERLYQSGVIMVLNPWVIQELRHVILAGVYHEEAQRRRMNWRQLFHQDKSYMPMVIQSIQQVEVLVDALPHLMHLPIHLERATDAVALDLMAAYHLDAADAYHIAIARADGINSFVTLDQGFGAVDPINLYTCDPVLLQDQTTATAILPFNPV